MKENSEFSIERIIGIHRFSTPEIIGMGGKIKKFLPDFIVREILPNGRIIYNGSEIGKEIGGLYVHCVLFKSGLDTFSAIKTICEKISIKEEDIGYAGLKDAAAVSYQRISIWNIDIERIRSFEFRNIKLINPIRQKFAVRIGQLLGNHFKIIIRDVQRFWAKNEWKIFTQHVKTKGLLNFYGPQRFGTKRPVLHLIGKLLLSGKYSEAIDLYIGKASPVEHEKISKIRNEYQKAVPLREVKLKFPPIFSIERSMLEGLEKDKTGKDIIFSLPKPFLRLSVSAYQSYLFNKLLSRLSEDKIPLNSDTLVPLPGYQTNQHEVEEAIWVRLFEILEEENTDLTSFSHPNSSLKSQGSMRPAIMFPNQLKYSPLEDEKSSTKIEFSLSKGSYATIVTREIMKT